MLSGAEHLLPGILPMGILRCAQDDKIYYTLTAPVCVASSAKAAAIRALV